MVSIHQMNLPISEGRFASAMRVVARQMGTEYKDGIISLPASWREDPTYPTALRVLYRKFPCSFFEHGKEGPCISFDVIPLGVRGDPRRFRAYQSFGGTVEESEELFEKLLRFLQRITVAVRQHQAL